MNLTENAQRVLEKRYLIKDNNGKPTEGPEGLFRRVANAVAQAEKQYGRNKKFISQKADEFYDLMTSFDFLPNSPTLMNAGKELGQLSACFVLPVEDSMDSIFETLKFTALIHKSGGGTGFSFNRLRPEGSIVASTSGVSSGPISFMSVFDAATNAVKQGGTRRGANMGILRVDHPDIRKFIESKKDPKKLNNFNISVGVTDEFMQALENNSTYSLTHPIWKGKVEQDNAREIFNMMIENAWTNGDPGVIFIDEINRLNPLKDLALIEATNPCGEQPLLPYESCNLGSINLSNFALDDEIQWDRLEQRVALSLRFLDNIIDINNFPMDKIKEMTLQNRKIGLGIMGWADLLIKLKIAYNTDKALNLAEKVMSRINDTTHTASIDLAKERGSFPNFKISTYGKNKEWEDKYPGFSKYGLRNATCTTIAPTGTISILANCSSGIEPNFHFEYEKHVLDGEILKIYHPLYEEYLNSKDHYEGEELPVYFISSHDISPEWHVRMQGAFQKFTDNAVSKTVNLPKSASIEDVKRIYMLSYELNCKGITIYRDSSRDEQVLYQSKKKIKGLAGANGLVPLERPERLSGYTYKLKTGYGNLYVVINELEGTPFEIFAIIGKSGHSITAKAEAICRLASLSLRSGISIEHIIQQLHGISGSTQTWTNHGLIKSLPDGIAKVLKRYMEEKGFDMEEITTNDLIRVNLCPLCRSPLIHESGCVRCSSCEYDSCA
jgi:ribonucleoside-diphosphate reductase alpha chain